MFIKTIACKIVFRIQISLEIDRYECEYDEKKVEEEISPLYFDLKTM